VCLTGGYVITKVRFQSNAGLHWVRTGSMSELRTDGAIQPEHLNPYKTDNRDFLVSQFAGQQQALLVLFEQMQALALS
jgi:hypothetical protein